jgi:anti-sigma B factor antagonist
MSLGEVDDGITRVALEGRLDVLGADSIGARFTAAVAVKGNDSIVDLSRVSFIASMGIRLLIAAARALDHKGGTLVLFGATGPVQDVLDDAALEQIMPIVATEGEALARLAH